jgi:hypothetical protein
MIVRSLGVALVALAALVAVARADDAEALKKAQQAFDQAQVDYLQGRYDEAAQHFQEAYKARPFPQFLYNVGASFHMKGKKANDVASYEKAVSFYKEYLKQEPSATDRPKVEKAIAVLEEEIKRLKGGGAAEPPKADNAVSKLGDVKVRGLVVVESEPQNATIYLDDKKKGPFAQTPWSGSLEGEHKVIIEKRGYRVVETTISADPSKLFVLRAAMSQEGYLGWIEINSNVPGADIYLDDKSVGAIGKTPLQQNIKPGKHKVWITAEGYNEYTTEVDVAAGETQTVKGTLTGNPVGRLSVQGLGIEDATIIVDGKVLCEHGPCIKSLPQGDHTITVERPGYKTYSKPISIEAKTETVVNVGLAQKPGRGDAVTAYVFTAIFAGGGIFLGLQANSLRDQLKKEIAAGNPPPDSNDPRFQRGKIFAIAADATIALAGITAITAIVYTFRDKGPKSTAKIDRRVLAIHPAVTPTYAGIGMEVSW